jgi:hypothetical protein
MTCARTSHWTKTTTWMALVVVLLFGLGTAAAYAVVPGSPTNIVVNGNGDGHAVAVSWSAVPGGSGYDIQYKKASLGDIAYAFAVEDLTDTAFDVLGLETGTSYTFRVRAVNTDGHGGWSTPWTATPTDVVAPNTTFETYPLFPDGNLDWFTAFPDYQLVADEPVSASFEWKVPGVVRNLTNTFTHPGDAEYLLGEGENTVEFKSVDQWENVEDTQTATIKVDMQEPLLNVDVTPGEADGTGGWYRTKPSFAIAAPDGTSGTAYIEYYWDDDPSTVVYHDHATVSGAAVPSGTGHTLTVKAYDVAGNEAFGTWGPYDIDTAAPTAPGTPDLTWGSGGHVTAEWDGSSDGGSGLDHYRVEWDTASSFSEPFSSDVYSGQSLTIDGGDNATYYFRVRAVDDAGNASAWSEGTPSIKADATAPSVTISPGGTGEGWVALEPAVTVGASDGASGVDEVRVYVYPEGSSDRGAYTAFSAADLPREVHVPEGAYVVDVNAFDNAGNSGWDYAVFRWDGTYPESMIDVSPAVPGGDHGWYRTAPSAHIDALDAGGSGLHALFVNGESRSWPYAITSAEGSATYSFYAVDHAGNIEESDSFTLRLDTRAPSVLASITPSGPDGSGGWYKNIPTVTVSGSDPEGGSGLEGFGYTWNAGSPGFAAGSGPVQFTGDAVPQGEDTLYVQSGDVAGNLSVSDDLSFKVDSVAPTAPSALEAESAAGGVMNLSWDASTDGNSGVAGYRAQWSTDDFETIARSQDVAAPATWTSWTGVDGTSYDVRVMAIDVAGNFSGYATADSVKSDATAPTIGCVPAGTGMAWVAAPLSFNLSATDTVTGVDHLQYKWGGAVFSDSGWLYAHELPIVDQAPFGSAVLWFRAADNAGNVSFWFEHQFFVDGTAPTTTFHLSPSEPNGDNGWYTSFDATPNITAADGQSGVAGITLDANPYTGGSAITIAQGRHLWAFFGTDRVGNYPVSMDTQWIQYDSVAPSLVLDTQTNGEGPVCREATVTVDATDGTSGVDRIEYTIATLGDVGLLGIEEPVWTTVYDHSATMAVPEGHWLGTVRAVDEAGNVSGETTSEVWVDRTAPVTEITVSPVDPDGTNGWYETPPVVTFDATDPIDDELTTWSRWDEGGWVAGDSATAPSTTGTHTLEYYSIDRAGNDEDVQSAEFKVDTQLPTASNGYSPAPPDGANGWFVTPPTLTITGEVDDGDAIVHTYYRMLPSDTWLAYEGPVTLTSEGYHIVEFYTVDARGHESRIGTFDYHLDTVAPAVGAISPLITTSTTPLLRIVVDDVTSGATSASFALPPSLLPLGSFNPVTGYLSYQVVSPFIEGENLVAVRGADDAGNDTFALRSVLVDTIDPDTTDDAATGYTTAATITLTPTDGGSGVARTWYAFDGAEPVEGTVIATSELGDHELQYWSEDVAGNVEDVHSLDFDVVAAMYTITSHAGPHGTITETQTVTAGDDQTFEMAAAEGYHIVNVLIDNIAIGPVASYTFHDVQADHMISVVFGVDTFTITTGEAAHGAITGPSVVDRGGDAAMLVTPDEGYHVETLVVDGRSITPAESHAFTNVVENHSISATFAINTYSITKDAGAHGAIGGPTSAEWGTDPIVTITPAEGYHTETLTLDGDAATLASSHTFTHIVANHRVAATFAINTFTITKRAGAHGSVTGPSGGDWGSDAVMSITPNEGYHVETLLVDGRSATPASSHTFGALAGDHEIEATFAINTYTITKSGGDHGQVTGPDTAEWGTDATITVTPDAGYHVASVTVNGVTQGVAATYSFNDITRDNAIVVTFAIDTFTVTATAGAHGAISPSGVAVVNRGADSATYTITPAAGYGISTLVVDGVSRATTGAYKFVSVTEDHTITATFRQTTALTIGASRTTASGGASVAYAGTLSPGMTTGTHVTVQIRKSTSGTWTNVSTRHTVHGHHWSYTLSTRTRSHGTYYVRASYAGSSIKLPVVSAEKRLTIR